ncbi:MAG: hypothetical protein M1337_07735, partial [Actinobacteria bacterium]|nr:hypothetical protein [Actinomycetota bacterium]
YSLVHAAGWSEVAARRRLSADRPAEETRIATEVNDVLEAALGDRSVFVRLGPGAEAEVGLYWLTDPGGSAPPLTERSEALILRLLRESPPMSEIEVDERVCAELAGLQTPDRRWVRTCLESYAWLDEADGVWHLRPEDGIAPRASDRREMPGLLRQMGEALGYLVQGEDPLVWYGGGGRAAWSFYVRETATLGDFAATTSEGEVSYILPGARAALVAERARRDPRIKAWLQSGSRVIKFRHLRRLAAETTLTREHWRERLAIDPIDESDPQLPLL